MTTLRVNLTQKQCNFFRLLGTWRLYSCTDSGTMAQRCRQQLGSGRGVGAPGQDDVPVFTAILGMFNLSVFTAVLDTFNHSSPMQRLI